MPRERIGAAERENAECRDGRAIFHALFADQSLQYFMNSAVPATGKDNVRSASDSLSCLIGSGTRSGSCDDFYLMSERGKRIGNLPHLFSTARPATSGNRVIDESAMHAMILWHGSCVVICYLRTPVYNPAIPNVYGVQLTSRKPASRIIASIFAGGGNLPTEAGR